MFILAYNFNTRNIDISNVETIEEDIKLVETVVSNEIKDESEKIKKIVTHVTLTCYQPVKEQCNSDFLHTADNSFIDLDKLEDGKIKWVAISQDLLWLFPMGSKVIISNEETGESYGTYLVKDKMNKRWNHRMDILIHPNSKERIFEKNIRVELI